MQNLFYTIIFFCSWNISNETSSRGWCDTQDSWYCYSMWLQTHRWVDRGMRQKIGNRDGVVMKALASNQCAEHFSCPGCVFRLVLVVTLSLSKYSGFPAPQKKPTLLNSVPIKTQDLHELMKQLINCFENPPLFILGLLWLQSWTKVLRRFSKTSTFELTVILCFLKKTPFSSLVTPSPPSYIAKYFVDVCLFPTLWKAEGEATCHKGTEDNSQLRKIWWWFSCLNNFCPWL